MPPNVMTHKVYAIKDNTKKTVICWYYRKKEKFIIYPEFMIVNHTITDQFIQNLKINPNKVHDLTGEMKRSLNVTAGSGIWDSEGGATENSVKHKIHQVIRIISKNGKTEYRGKTYAKNKVVLEPGWISDAFQLRESEFYKLVTTVTLDDDSTAIYTVSVGRCNGQTSDDESKYEEKRENALIGPGESISKKEPS